MQPISLRKFKDSFPKDRVSVGLDIGASAIKIAKLKISKETTELFGFSVEPYQNDLPVALKRAVQAQGIERVNLSVSGPATIIRYAYFPKMTSAELKQALKFEAQKHIPFSMDEINLDAYILNANAPEAKMLVVLAAVKKDFLNQRLGLLKDASVRANVVDIDSLALINAFNFNCAEENSGKSIALLNIGAVVSNLSILEDGIPRLSRDIHMGGKNFTQKIVETLGLDFNSAEELKLNPDKEKALKVSLAFEAVLTKLAAEIRTSFDYYESQSASSVGKIFLSGGASLYPGLKGMLAGFLGMEVDYWDPLKRVSISGTVDTQKIKPLSSKLAVAVGLALRE